MQYFVCKINNLGRTLSFNLIIHLFILAVYIEEKKYYVGVYACLYFVTRGTHSSVEPFGPLQKGLLPVIQMQVLLIFIMVVWKPSENVCVWRRLSVDT